MTTVMDRPPLDLKRVHANENLSFVSRVGRGHPAQEDSGPLGLYRGDAGSMRIDRYAHGNR